METINLPSYPWGCGYDYTHGKTICTLKSVKLTLIDSVLLYNNLFYNCRDYSSNDKRKYTRT